MALLNTNEILQMNKKIKTFVMISAGSTDVNDVDLFVVAPPPPVRDIAHSAPVKSMTTICDICRNALEYFSYYCETSKLSGEDAVEDLPAACLLHAGAQSLQRGEDAGCHLCVLIMSDLRTKRLSMESVDQSSIEMCWQSNQQTPARVHFALTHNGHERSSNNYWNFLKLQLWPCSEFGTELFGAAVSSSEIVRAGNTGSELSRDRAVQWLSRCQANEDGRHDQCNQHPEDWLPTRLLDVTHALETSKLKLVTPCDNPDAFVSDKQYVTLSHCWGAWGSTELPVLTTENLSERQAHGLDNSLLPQTFKDALEVARWFQVRWLWIDSLCIIQDSTEDWQQEAVMMYSVYKNSLLNISADDSNDARWGCFRNRDPLSVCPMRLQIPGLENWAYWLTPDTNALFGAISKAPLSKRAWVFQERQLSRRVLHFTSSELIWECCAEGPYFASETFPDGAPLKTVFNERPKFQSQSDLRDSGPIELYKAWDKLRQAYSEKNLSHISDKAVALSGLAQEFQDALPNDTYVAGLWRATLPESLLWKSLDRYGRIETTGYIAPSWSWLSIDGSISHSASRETVHSLVDIVSVDIDPVIPSKPTASLRSASLDLWCYLRPIEIRPDYEKKPWYLLAIGGGKEHKLIVKDGGKTLPDTITDSFEFSFDVPYDEDLGPTSVTGYFLPLCIEQPTESSAKTIRGLIVEPVSDRLTEFRRIGMMGVHGSQCLPIGYKLKNCQDDGGNSDEENSALWNSLQDLMRSSYDSFKNLKEDTDDKEEKESNASSASVPNDRRSRDLEADDQTAQAESVASNKAEEKHLKVTETKNADVEGETTMSEGNEKATVEEELGINKKDNDAAEKPQPRVDLSSIGALERMYALDSAFMGSELEARFERLVPQRVILV
ncbi:hypothetical protein VM1G_09857 [Cytospora mali]|uniref:Heterokaryon incompatibility domain-containing protein n=1 Tax=Cytospora mali TaxID=578113 RepID=A0A194WDA7_CYTMA|nr:hypothetical protein VM1G_09857 [Valsa mali]